MSQKEIERQASDNITLYQKPPPSTPNYRCSERIMKFRKRVAHFHTREPREKWKPRDENFKAATFQNTTTSNILRLSGSHRSTRIRKRFGIAGARIAGQTAARVRIAGILHRSILKTCRIFTSQANIAEFLQGLFCYPHVMSDQWVLAPLVEKLFRIASDVGVCDSNHIAYRGSIARFGPLSRNHENHGKHEKPRDGHF